jgi:hypothetical protein
VVVEKSKIFSILYRGAGMNSLIEGSILRGE